MSNYAADINTNDYYNNQPIYIQEVAGVYNSYVPIKLSINASNFNFDTILSDGLDFRLAEAQNGTSVLKMWVAYWDTDAQHATLFFDGLSFSNAIMELKGLKNKSALLLN